MTGFELQTSGIGSDRSDNWTTTTFQPHQEYFLKVFFDAIDWNIISKVSSRFERVMWGLIMITYLF